MAPRPSHQMPWRLACAALFATLGVATTSKSNSSTGIGFDGTISLQYTNRNKITTLVPLTQNATQQDLESELVYTTDSNTGNFTQNAIAYISCDPSSYTGNINPDGVLNAVYSTGNPQAAVLYSTTSNYCNYTASDPTLSDSAIYSTTNMTEAKSLEENLKKRGADVKFFVSVARSGTQDNGDNGGGSGDGQQPTNPLGPSPSTAVAMIILYSITGVITALFLVIIVTGAVRAHRHPDRYGPRDVMGRPRQSRARGLGMAILDTIPIVKFGEREQPKPTDVELGSTSDTRHIDTANTQSTAPAVTAAEESTGQTTTDSPPDTATRADPHMAALDSGIAPAQPTAGASVAHVNSSSDEGLGCSICTDDFEKGQDIRLLPCNHKFHPECVDPWLLNVSGTCPLCRVDLRPVTSHDSSSSHPSNSDANALALAPPLQSDSEPSSRRHSTLRDVLSFRSRPNASADERISALRRLREQRRNGSNDVVASASANPNASNEDVAQDRRRSKRMSVRLSGVFGGRRRGDSVREEPGESSSSAQAQPPLPSRTDDSQRRAGDGVADNTTSDTTNAHTET